MKYLIAALLVVNTYMNVISWVRIDVVRAEIEVDSKRADAMYELIMGLMKK